MSSTHASSWEEHFDELAELEGDARAGRLAEIARANPDLARFLAELLAADSGTAHILDRMSGPGTGPTDLIAPRAPRLVAAALAESGPADAGAGSRDRAGERIGNYRLRSLLGRGGMAEVWLAERADGEFDSRVALKLMRPEVGSDAIVERFLRERRILARLDHPGIARLLDGGRSESGEPYFVLDHVDGTPIDRWCAGRGLPLAGRLRLMIEVCEAVDHAHRNLIVHRDLKPSNVLVDRAGRAKLLDFGIAKLLAPEPGSAPLWESGRLQFGARAFTPAYAAPEQVRGEPVTTATDVWALGVLLYQLLTGEKPFARTGRPLPALQREVEAETLEPPSARLRRVGDVPARRRAGQVEGDLDAIVGKALARAPADRYPGAEALAADLRRHLDRRPVRARPATVGLRAGRFVARHRLGVAAAALAVVSLLTGLAVALWQAHAARAAAQRAERARGFLLSVFAALDPEQARGEAMTPRSLVDTGLRRAERELADEPALRAEMLDLFANLDRKLGALEEARALAARALDLRRVQFGDSSTETARSRATLGWIRLDQGELKEARALLERAVADLERREGPDSLAAADAREPLSEAIFAGEGPGPALRVVERRLATYRRALDPGHEKIGVAFNDRGVVLLELERLGEAEAAFRTSLAILRARLPADDPRLAYPCQNLATLLLRRGRHAEAEQQLRAALTLRRRILGPRHPETGMTLGYLAMALAGRGQLVPAEQAARQAVEILAGRDLFSAATARLVLAEVLFRQQRSAAALVAFDQGLKELAALVSPDHPMLLGYRRSRARVLLALNRKQEGIAELESLLARVTKLGEAVQGLRGDLLLDLGRERRKAGHPAEARDLHEQSRQIWTKLLGKDHPDVALIEIDLALDLAALPGPDAKARAIALLHHVRVVLRRVDPHHPDLPKVEQQLAKLVG